MLLLETKKLVDGTKGKSEWAIKSIILDTNLLCGAFSFVELGSSCFCWVLFSPWQKLLFSWFFWLCFYFVVLNEFCLPKEREKRPRKSRYSDRPCNDDRPQMGWPFGTKLYTDQNKKKDNNPLTVPLVASIWWDISQTKRRWKYLKKGNLQEKSQ